MSSPNVLSAEDQAFITALNGLESQISAMITSGQTVERINEEIAAGYVSGASTAFQGRVNDWVERYKNVMQAFQKLQDATQGASTVLNKAEEDAHVMGGNWGASDGVFSALSPS
ncbi:hypothetical protein [Kitasatospora viridis]|uniref:Uncharacterized protein n=1 Tax=Kitasatospora viridis TaxID=281105 RepID=A0A561UCX6_9ACTN|nr:hypothetical protein [Kitasatospora viridis]TWF97234.1 hypothetical protein FHX73_111014 [Kitasatospora viridis]